MAGRAGFLAGALRLVSARAGDGDFPAAFLAGARFFCAGGGGGAGFLRGARGAFGSGAEAGFALGLGLDAEEPAAFLGAAGLGVLRGLPAGDWAMGAIVAHDGRAWCALYGVGCDAATEPGDVEPDDAFVRLPANTELAGLVEGYLALVP